MKKIILIISGIFFITICNAQIGVNIENPQGMLHIDPKQNTTINPAGGFQDDVVIDYEGNMGIGTLTSSEKLHVEGDTRITKNTEIGGNLKVAGSMLVKRQINLGDEEAIAKIEVVSNDIESGMRIEGATSNSGKYLTSDENGIGTWKYVRPNSVFEEGVLNDETNSVTVSTNKGGADAYINITKTSLKLDKGKWLITAKCILHTPYGGSVPELYVWMCLKENGSVVNEVGIQPEASGARISTPQVMYIAHITEPKEYTIGVYTVSNTVFKTYGGNGSFFGQPHFYAIKLDDQ